MKKLLIMLMSVLMVSLSCVACSSKNKDTLDDGVLTIGYTIYAPMNYYDESNNLIGFDTELAQKVGEKLGVQVKFVEINWNNKVLSLNSYEIDAVWNGMTITEELKNVMCITSPYLENKQVIVCKKGEEDKYKTKDSLKLATGVYVEAGSAGENTANSLGITATTVEAQKDTLLEVKTDASKIAIIDETMAKVLVGSGTSYSDLTYVDVGFDVEQFGIGFRKNDSKTCEKVEKTLQELKDDGTIQELMEKYFG